MLKIVNFYFRIASVICPKIAANQAFELFKKVRKKDIRNREKSFYDSAKRKDIPFTPESVHTYSFGNPEHDIVLLIHGWNSNAGSLSKFVEPLLAKEKYVISLNLPAHAQYKAEKTTIVECKDALKAIINSIDSNKKISIISHSFGSAIAGYALSEMPNLQVDKLLFLTSPNKIDIIFTEFKAMIGLGQKAYRLLVKKANKVLGEDLEVMYMHDKLNLASFNQLHIFHDKNDKIISVKNSELMAQKVPNSDLTIYENIGHYRMLWNEKLINDVITKIL